LPDEPELVSSHVACYHLILQFRIKRHKDIGNFTKRKELQPEHYCKFLIPGDRYSYKCSASGGRSNKIAQTTWERATVEAITMNTASNEANNTR